MNSRRVSQQVEMFIRWLFLEVTYKYKIGRVVYPVSYRRRDRFECMGPKVCEFFEIPVLCWDRKWSRGKRAFCRSCARHDNLLNWILENLRRKAGCDGYNCDFSPLDGESECIYHKCGGQRECVKIVDSQVHVVNAIMKWATLKIPKDVVKHHIVPHFLKCSPKTYKLVIQYKKAIDTPDLRLWYRLCDKKKDLMKYFEFSDDGSRCLSVMDADKIFTREHDDSDDIGIFFYHGKTSRIRIRKLHFYDVEIVVQRYNGDHWVLVQQKWPDLLAVF